MFNADPSLLDRLVFRISQVRFAYSNEASLQNQINELFTSIAPGRFEREFVFDNPKSGRIDFFFPVSGIGVEVKAYGTGGSGAQTFTQLLKYAEVPEITSLILICGKALIASQIPSEILGKSIRIIIPRTRMVNI